MIVVRVELWSAITGQRTELARMHVVNDGTGDARRGTYTGVTFFGRDSVVLNALRVSRTASVPNWPRQQLHVWNLVRRMLAEMGYTK